MKKMCCDLTNELKLAEVISALQKGAMTPLDLLIEIEKRMQQNEPILQCFLPEKNRFERLRRELIELEKAFPDKKKRPPLFGIPIGVKDLFSVHGFSTKAGSKLQASLFTSDESPIVTQLKQLGSLILGKTVTTEFAYFAPGATKNPLDTKRTPGGSSSGSAAAVSAGFVPFALGTQTIGSVSRPAAYCGVIGFKPTKGRLTTKGIVPFSPTIDQPGWFTHDLAGSKIIASLVLENWKPETEVQTPVIGIPHKAYLNQAEPLILQGFYDYINQLKKRNFQIIETELFSDIEEINAAHNDLIAYEFAQVHKKWVEQFRELYHPKTLDLIEKGKMISPDCKKTAPTLQKKVLTQMQELKANIDIFLSPATTSLPPLGLDSTGSPLMNLPWTFLGAPTFSVPYLPSNSDLPIGIQFAAMPNEDEKLVRVVLLLNELTANS
jgi:Asp-tRNA(Asn)/Glu-tRNA(Gln) amidotransferase A subunit family amidase